MGAGVGSVLVGGTSTVNVRLEAGPEDEVDEDDVGCEGGGKGKGDDPGAAGVGNGKGDPGENPALPN